MSTSAWMQRGSGAVYVVYARYTRRIARIPLKHHTDASDVYL